LKKQGDDSLRFRQTTLAEVAVLKKERDERDQDLIQTKQELQDTLKANQVLEASLASADETRHTQQDEISILRSTLSQTEEATRQALKNEREIRQQFDEVHVHFTQATQDYQKALETNEDLRSKLESAKTNEQAMLQEMNPLKTSIQQHQAAVKKLNSNMTQLKSRLIETELKLSHKQALLTQSQETLQRQLEDNSKFRSQTMHRENELTREIKELNQNLTQTTLAYHKTLETNEALETQLKKSHSDETALQNELTKLQATLSQKREEVTTLSKTLQDQKSAAVQLRIETQANIQNLHKRIDTLYIEKNVAEKAFEQNKATLKVQRTKSASLLQEQATAIKQYKSKLLQTSQDRDQALQDKVALESQFQKTQKYLTQTQEQYKKSEQERADSEKRLDDIFIEKNILDIKTKALLNERVGLTAKVEANQRSLDEMRFTMKKLEQETLQARQIAQSKSMKALIAIESAQKLAKEVDQTKSSNNKLRTELNEVKSEFSRTLSRNLQLKTSRTELEKQLKDLTVEKAALYKELDRANEEIEQIKTMLSKTGKKSASRDHTSNPLSRHLKELKSRVFGLPKLEPQKVQSKDVLSVGRLDTKPSSKNDVKT